MCVLIKISSIVWSKSSLIYPITLLGRWGTRDDFTSIPFHLVLSSAALAELAKSIPVHSLILCSRLFFWLPFLLFPYTVPCKIIFAKPEDIETCPNHLSFRFLTKVRSLSYFSNGCLDLSANIHIGDMVLCMRCSVIWMPLALFAISFVFSALISILYCVQVLSRRSTGA